MSSTTETPTSRAVIRLIEPGNTANCLVCGEQVKFMARVQGKQVIANVYDDGKWIRVEHFHAECYENAGKPYGEPSLPTPKQSTT